MATPFLRVHAPVAAVGRTAEMEYQTRYEQRAADGKWECGWLVTPYDMGPEAGREIAIGIRREVTMAVHNSEHLGVGEKMRIVTTDGEVLRGTLLLNDRAEGLLGIEVGEGEFHTVAYDAFDRASVALSNYAGTFLSQKR